MTAFGIVSNIEGQAEGMGTEGLQVSLRPDASNHPLRSKNPPRQFAASLCAVRSAAIRGAHSSVRWVPAGCVGVHQRNLNKGLRFPNRGRHAVHPQPIQCDPPR